MSGFLWASGHLGWGIFALAVFSCVWLLLSDLVWRLRSAAIIRLASAMAAGWVAGAVLIVLGFYFFNR